MNKYESVIIINPSVDEEQVKAFVQLMAIGDNDCINDNKIYRYD